MSDEKKTFVELKQTGKKVLRSEFEEMNDFSLVSVNADQNAI